MKIRNLFLVSVLVLLAAAFLGCSADNAVTPSTVGDALGSADKATGTLCHVYGNVYEIDSDYAVGVQVRIDVGYVNGNWSSPVFVTTGQYGNFTWDTYLWTGQQVRCASLGDVESRYWLGEANLYFRLDQQPGFHNDYFPMIQP